MLAPLHVEQDDRFGSSLRRGCFFVGNLADAKAGRIHARPAGAPPRIPSRIHHLLIEHYMVEAHCCVRGEGTKNANQWLIGSES